LSKKEKSMRILGPARSDRVSLERENKHLRLAFGSVVIGVLIAVIAGATKREEKVRTLESQRIEIKDENGHVRILLDGTSELPSLLMYDKDNMVRSSLSIGSEDRSALNFFDKKGNSCASIEVTADGRPRLSFNNNGKTILLGINSDGNPVLTVEKNHRTATLGILGDDTATLVLGDPISRSRIELTSESDGTQFLILYLKDKTRALMGVRPDGSAGFTIGDDSQKSRGELAISPEGLVMLDLLNGDEKVRVRATVPIEGETVFELLDKDGKKQFSIPK
jgi:hypothetical protein